VRSMIVRAGGVGDVQAVLALLDRAVAWLAQQGRQGQWGTVPFSQLPAAVRQVEGYAESGGLRVAQAADGNVVGALVLGAAPSYAPPAPEPELYLRAFVTDRDRARTGIGAALLDRARQEALDQGVRLLRVDCWAGGDGALVRYYLRAGFTRGPAVTVGGWQGQILEQRLHHRKSEPSEERAGQERAGR
jgi:GNAT superfamily N-acetyltransferase